MVYTAATSSRWPILAVTLAVVLCCPRGAHAQGSQRGLLVGGVRTSNGDPLPGVTVTASSAALQGQRVITTRANGEYTIRDLPPGLYRVLFELEGLRGVERTATVELGRIARADAMLEFADIADTMIVESAAQTALDNTQVGANYTAEMADFLAIGRAPVEITDLAPGVSDRTPEAAQVSISGGYGYDNVILLDGVDINDTIFGSPSAGGAVRDDGLFIEDAIQETQVLTAAVSAEYGRFSGGVVNMITKSGGNQLAGSLRLDLSDPSWRDETPFENELGLRREGDRSEVLTATFGGPILEDHLWFFAAARDTERSESSVFAVTGLPHPSSFQDERWELKLTATVHDRHTLQATRLETDTALTGAQFPGISMDARTLDLRLTPADLSVLRYSGIFDSNLLLEVQYSEKNLTIVTGGTELDLRDSPFVTFNQAEAHYNAPFFDRSDPVAQGNEQIAAALSYLLSTAAAGTHDLKMGLERFTVLHRWGGAQSPNDYFFVADYQTDDSGAAILDGDGRPQPVFSPFGVLALEFPTVPGSEGQLETTSLYLNDRWAVGDRWSFNLGLRYERVTGEATGGIELADTNSLVPRLAVSWDPKGDGRFRLGGSYSEYSGGHNISQFLWTSEVGPTRSIRYLYAGPPGVGLDFAPGFDLDNYFPVFGRFPGENVSFEDGLSSPRSSEITLSAGMLLPRDGYVEATFTTRSLSDIHEDFITFDNGVATIELRGGTLELDSIEFRNTDLASRDYEALQVQGRYRLAEDWTLDGHWTYQLENHGNFEGEAVDFPGAWSILSDYPEILVPERNAPHGRLDDFQRHKVRLWTTYGLGLGRVGRLDLGLLYRYDSARTYSLVSAFAPVSDLQLARDPGYARPPGFQPVFFGTRGSQDFDDSHLFDLAVKYSIPLWKWVEPWAKLGVRNLFNDKSRIGWDTAVFPDSGGPADEHGIPTQYVESPTFGQARSTEDYVTPREFLVSLGIRF